MPLSPAERMAAHRERKRLEKKQNAAVARAPRDVTIEDIHAAAYPPPGTPVVSHLSLQPRLSAMSKERAMIVLSNIAEDEDVHPGIRVAACRIIIDVHDTQAERDAERGGSIDYGLDDEPTPQLETGSQ